jgi:hypothetical protein
VDFENAGADAEHEPESSAMNGPILYMPWQIMTRAWLPIGIRFSNRRKTVVLALPGLMGIPL